MNKTSFFNSLELIKETCQKSKGCVFCPFWDIERDECYIADKTPNDWRVLDVVKKAHRKGVIK